MSIYLDNNATTHIDPVVLDEMLPYLRDNFGNPSSIHSHGREAKLGMDIARERVADLIGAQPEEIIFTSSGTESANQALTGVLKARRTVGAHLIVSSIEHQAILNTAHFLEMEGASTSYLPVDADGVVSVQALKDVARKDTVLVSIMTANNDVGTLQPIGELTKISRKLGITFHTDAVQAVGKIPVEVSSFGVDLLSFSAHKIHGPKGVGALYVKAGTRVSSFIHGGHQESRRRAGTENVAGIVGFGKACELASDRLKKDSARISALRDNFETDLLQNLDGLVIHGPQNTRLPGTSNISFLGIEGETLLMALDLAGVSASTGSACTSDNSTFSHVLAAMGCEPAIAISSVRFSFGRENDQTQMEQTVATIKQTVARLRKAYQ